MKRQKYGELKRRNCLNRIKELRREIKINPSVLAISELHDLYMYDPSHIGSICGNRKEDTQEAIRILEEGMKQIEDDPYLLFILGNDYQALGDREKAKENWQKASDMEYQDAHLRLKDFER